MTENGITAVVATIQELSRQHKQLGMDNLAVWWGPVQNAVLSLEKDQRLRLADSRRPNPMSVRAWELVIRLCKNPQGATAHAEAAIRREQKKAEVPKPMRTFSKAPILELNGFGELAEFLPRFASKLSDRRPMQFRMSVAPVATLAYGLAHLGFQPRKAQSDILLLGAGAVEIRGVNMFQFLPALAGYEGATTVTCVGPELVYREPHALSVLHHVQGTNQVVKFIPQRWEELASDHPTDWDVVCAFNPGFGALFGLSLPPDAFQTLRGKPLIGTSYAADEAARDRAAMEKFGCQTRTPTRNPWMMDFGENPDAPGITNCWSDWIWLGTTGEPIE